MVHNPRYSRQRGAGLLESLICLTVIVLAITLGVPGWQGMQRATQLKGVLESSYFALQYARAVAKSSASDVTVSFVKDSDWCLAANDSGPCDCRQLNACQILGIEQVVHSRDFPLVQLVQLSFGQEQMTKFNAIRGTTIGHAGSLVFSDGQNLARLVVSNLGRLRICVEKGSLGTYSPC